MKKILLSYVFIFIFCLVYAQNKDINAYEIEYEKTLNFESGGNSSSYYVYTKFIELDKSIFDKKTDLKNQNTLFESENTLIKSEDDDNVLFLLPKGKNISLVYKDYMSQQIFFKNEISFKYFVVQDSLNIFNWEINENKKDILGYSCQLAKMDFRGRHYEAWFTTELPTGGPWKYDGLPGLILEITTLDGFITFKATSIKNGYFELENLENPFSKEKVLTWQEFIELYKLKAIELMSYRPTESSRGVELSRGGIENYISDDDVDYNKALEKMQKQ